MTYTEIIDNINNRINNVISERLGGSYMHVTIEPSNYNPNIDDEITVTIKATDHNDDPIPNWTVPLLINGVAVTDTIKTGTDGTATYTYTCTNWGLCRFSVKSFSTQLYITGQKKVKEGSNWSGVNYILYVDEAHRNATLSMTLSNKNIATGTSNYEMTGWIPSKYRPKANKFGFGYRGLNNVVYTWTNGNVGVANTTSSTQSNVTISCQIDWNY